MYTNPQRGQVAAGTAAPTLHVGTYRRALLAAIIGNDLFTAEEQLRANHAAHECQDTARLALWTRNVLRVAKERAAQQQAEGLANLAEGLVRFEATLSQAPATQPVAPAPWATPTQCDEVFRLVCLPCFTAGEKAHALRRLPHLTQASATREIGSLYATALRRSSVKLFTDGATCHVV